MQERGDEEERDWLRGNGGVARRDGRLFRSDGELLSGGEGAFEGRRGLVRGDGVVEV